MAVARRVRNSSRQFVIAGLFVYETKMGKSGGIKSYAVVACTDAAQLPFACVAVITAGRHLEGMEASLFVVAQGCSVEDLAFAKTFCADHGQDTIIIPFDIPDRLGKERAASGHITHAAFLRLYLDELLSKDFEKVLYIDTDVMVVGGLRDLLDTNFAGNVLAAHADRYVEARVPTHCSKDLNVAQKGYFNSGVILFNWPQVLKSSFLARTRKLSAARPDLDLWDQDPLNIVADGNWLRMDGRYNATRYVTSVGEWPVILHFTSSEKPWLPNYYLRQLKFRRAYRRFLAGTRWADYVKPKSAVGWLIVLWEPVMWWQQRRVGLDWQKKQSSRR